MQYAICVKNLFPFLKQYSQKLIFNTVMLISFLFTFNASNAQICWDNAFPQNGYVGIQVPNGQVDKPLHIRSYWDTQTSHYCNEATIKLEHREIYPNPTTPYLAI